MSILQGLCNYNEQLYAAWKGSGDDQHIYYSSFDGSKWSAQANIEYPKPVDNPILPLEILQFAESNIGASLAFFQNQLYAAWKGSGDDQHIYYSSFDGSKWSAQVAIN